MLKISDQGWPCRTAIRGPVAGLDTPRVVLTGSYLELRAFEIAYDRLKAEALGDVSELSHMHRSPQMPERSRLGSLGNNPQGVPMAFSREEGGSAMRSISRELA